MTTSKLRSIEAQVFGRHELVGAVIPPLEHGPETLQPVDMGLTLNELKGAVFDGFVGLRDALISPVLVGIDGGVGVDVVGDEPLRVAPSAWSMCLT